MLQQLVRMWWPGARIGLVVVIVSFVWELLGRGYALVAGWMPPPLYWGIGIVISIVFVPIVLYAGVAEVLKLRE